MIIGHLIVIPALFTHWCQNLRFIVDIYLYSPSHTRTYTHILLRHRRSRSSRMPAHAAYVFSPKQTPKHPERAWLGDTPTLPKIKAVEEVIASPLSGPSLSAGVIGGDVRSQCTFPVACQPDACWQHPPFDSSCVAARLQESRQRREGRCRKTAGGPRAPRPCSWLAPPSPTSTLASLSQWPNVEWWNESEKFLDFSPIVAGFPASAVTKY